MIYNLYCTIMRSPQCPTCLSPKNIHSVLRTGHDTRNINDFQVALCNLQIPWTGGHRPVSGNRLAGVVYNYIFSTIFLWHTLSHKKCLTKNKHFIWKCHVPLRRLTLLAIIRESLRLSMRNLVQLWIINVPTYSIREIFHK